MKIPAASLLLWLALGGLPSSAATPPLHHDLEVRLVPEDHRIEVEARLAPAEALAMVEGAYPFLLHEDLAPRIEGSGWRLAEVEGSVEDDFFGLNATSVTLAENAPLRGWRLVPRPGASPEVTLAYEGRIHHPLETGEEEYQRGFDETPGIISPEGVFLAGASYWVPDFGDGLVTFELVVRDLPAGWHAVSQGERQVTLRRRNVRTGHSSAAEAWIARQPVDEIYLVAGPWTMTREQAGETAIYAYLREAEDASTLAARYLDATRRYLDLYEGMLTPYPWPSFAVVENFWDTGYGMPGFTLLGPRILRFPFILTSSYPHEILHNWWGNSIYIDPEQGNWAEGLTAYMADHLFAEQRGEGALHRRATLQKYADFVREGKDFPLAEFRSRHSAATEAVGYGKALMVFHMLRRHMGDEAFLEAMRRFHREHRYERAGWRELASAFEAETGEDWSGWFSQWVDRAGAPRLEVGRARVRSPETGSDDSWELRLLLRQAQEGEPYELEVPVAVTAEGVTEAVVARIPLTRGVARTTIRLPGRPLRLDVDPAFEVMRRLDPREVPPALSTMFGVEDPLYVLPSAAPPAERKAWRELAEAWQGGAEPRFAEDDEIDHLPEGAVWLLGWENRLRETITEARSEEIAALQPGGEAGFLDRTGSRVALARREGDPLHAAAWVAADRIAAIPGLARKLPHYTRYSYLAFTGDEPTNTLKGMWEPKGSPLTVDLTDGPLAPLELPTVAPLAEPPPRFDAATLEGWVETLAAPKMEGRGLETEGIERATSFAEDLLSSSGLEPAGAKGFRSAWTAAVGPEERAFRLTNLLARKPGTDPALGNDPVLVMAHLDHLGRGWPDVRAGNEGKIHPGADDNASGVASLLAVARALGQGPPLKRPVLFALTTGEEAGLVGSRRLLARMQEQGRLPMACVNLDTVGRLDEAGKVLVLNADSAREWAYLWMGVGYTTGTKYEAVTEPLDASDQTACIERGVPAVQLTTGPHLDYHRPTDTAEKVDAAGLVEISEGLLEAVHYLAERAEPLTSRLEGATPQAAESEGEERGRRVSLGTMPDFAWQGPGVKVQQVLPDSAAAAAGIEAGDVLVAFDGEEVPDLRTFSRLLKAHEAGDRITVEVLRGAQRIELEATLRAR